MTEQEKIATAVMEEWLSHPSELGKKPAKLEIAGVFELHELRYYIFRFKKTAFGEWKVAVCGGYEGEGLGHCGHIYSEMEAYHPDTAEQKCIEMVEKMRRYWMEQAEQCEKEGEKKVQAPGNFIGFVLLSEPVFAVEELRRVLKEDWGITCEEDSEDIEQDGTRIAFYENGMMATAGLMETEIPGNEAEYWANSNFMARERALAAAKDHKAHLLLAVLGRDEAPLEAGKLFVKLASACLKASNALGIYECGTVWLPEQFLSFAEVMKDGELPLPALVFVGLYQDEKGVSSWTNGLRAFGKEELEIVGSSHSPEEVYGMMFYISEYVLEEGAVLRDGQTIGLSAEQKLSLTFSAGVFMEGMSMKIGF